MCKTSININYLVKFNVLFKFLSNLKYYITGYVLYNFDLNF